MFLLGCDDSDRLSTESDFTSEQANGGGISSDPADLRRETLQSRNKSGGEIAEGIQLNHISELEGEVEFLEWLRSNGLEDLDELAGVLQKLGEPGEVTPGEEAFSQALVRFYHESDDVFLGEVLEKIAYSGVYRGELVRTFSSKLVESAPDPNGPVLDLLTRGVPESVHPVHYMKIIEDSAKYGDPRKILSQVPDPDDGAIGMVVVSKLAPLMLRETPEATIKYFTEMKASPLKDAGTFFIAKYSAEQGDYEVARNWAENTSNEKIRSGAIEYIDRLESINRGE